MSRRGGRWPDDPVPLTIAPAEPGGTAARVRIEGELDMAGCDAFLREVRATARPGRPLEIDLRGLTFLDSTGGRALLAADRLARRAGATAVVFRARPEGSVGRVLSLFALDRVLDVQAA